MENPEPGHLESFIERRVSHKTVEPVTSIYKLCAVGCYVLKLRKKELN
jgi:hypothetical protein